MTIPTSGIVGISFSISNWKDITPDSAKLLLFDFPIHTTKKTYKKAIKIIADQLAVTLEDVLEDIEPELSKQLATSIKATSKQMAKEVTKVLHPLKIETIVGATKRSRVDNLQAKQKEG